MKKFVSLILALVLVFSLTVSASAETYTTGNDNKVVTIKKDVPDKATVYYVIVNWGTLDFTYTYTSQTWIPERHVYEAGENSEWNQESTTITVTNHSNAVVQVDAFLSNADGTGTGTSINLTEVGTDVRVYIDGSASFSLADASLTAYETPGGADNSTFKVCVEGTPDTTKAVDVTVTKYLTISISAVS